MEIHLHIKNQDVGIQPIVLSCKVLTQEQRATWYHNFVGDRLELNIASSCISFIFLRILTQEIDWKVWELPTLHTWIEPDSERPG